jgi:hypothetical protein
MTSKDLHSQPAKPFLSPRVLGWAFLFFVILPSLLVLIWNSHETARELLAKSAMTIAGWLATPFILESSAAVVGIIVVLTYNEWRSRKEGPEWVEMYVDESTSAPPSIADLDKK